MKGEKLAHFRANSYGCDSGISGDQVGGLDPEARLWRAGVSYLTMLSAVLAFV